MVPQRAKEGRDPLFDTNKHLSFSSLQRLFKQAKKDARHNQRQEAIEKLIRAAPPTLATWLVHHADCRAFNWPDKVDCIVTDPPWAELAPYRWLAEFAAQRLQPGNHLFVQCGNNKIGAVSSLLLQAGLTEVWTLIIVYPSHTAPHVTTAYLPFGCGYRPVLVYSNGKRNPQGLETAFDTQRVDRFRKEFFEWEQPPEPWLYWLNRLTRPGELIVDPFAGTGTTGLAVKSLGQGRRFLGTEKDEQRAKLAQARINREEA
jgi:16S rRNA G966 N2-methylase RsmD